MLPEAPQPQVWIHRFRQPPVEVPHFRQRGPHNIDALTHAMGDGVQRIGRQNQLDYGISPNAPATFPDLISSMTSRLVVFSEFSENTVYGDPNANRAQRAWHDGIHPRLNAGFDLASELRVARQQANEMALMSGDRLADWVYADLYASAYHMALYGHFPDDQLSLVLSVMTTGHVGRF